MGQYVLPHITVPQLIHLESEDFAQAIINGLPLPPWNTSTEINYVLEWRKNATKLLQAVASPPHAVFSPACPWHCALEGQQFWTIQLTTGPNLVDVSSKSRFLKNFRPFVLSSFITILETGLIVVKELGAVLIAPYLHLPNQFPKKFQSSQKKMIKIDFLITLPHSFPLS